MFLRREQARLRAHFAAVLEESAEAARVQPTYCYETKATWCFCNWYPSGVGGVLEATVVVAEGDDLRAQLRVDAVHGEVFGTQVGQEITAHVVARDLTFPVGVTFDGQGRPVVLEAGYSYGEVFTIPRPKRAWQPALSFTVGAGF